ncbi:MAG: aldehyde ferredoxin oxidoreductase family protein [Chloroflexi bacterium]|nr:aldehyde ferredoxin oxidoreductase family protein [Chloroflexota bacterium]
MQPILTLDLTRGESGIYEIPEDWQRDYLGGSGLAARILYDALTPELDPLGQEAPLLFLNGPLSGTAGPTVGRFVVCAKSPATGLWGESNCGGFWGVELRKTGFDGLLLTGRAEGPVYLFIDDGDVDILPAAHLWGKDTYTIQEAINDEIKGGKVRVLGIGPAGENLLPSALLLADHGRVAGRTGMGAVLGSKNVKAIAVRGTQPILVADPARYDPLRSAANRALKGDNFTITLREMGSATAADYFDYLGEMPKKHFQAGVMEGVERLSGASISESILVGYSACHACVVACGRVVQLPGEKHKRKGPEYETLMGFGANLWIDDPAFVTRMGEICDIYGMDSISTSNTLGLAFSLYELGIITKSDTGGLELEWGSHDVVERLLHMVPAREGFGAQLAEGARALGRRYAAEERAVQVNGLEVAYHDPRGASGMALVYATSPRGACHNQSDYFLVDIGQVEETLGMEFHERQGGADKAANVAKHQDWRTVFNSLVICYFGNVPPETVLDLINTACGLEWGIAQMLRCGERAWNLKRIINNRLGVTRANDTLPKALLEPLPDGGSAGYIVPFDEMLRAYYKARDWDWETGRPTPAKLHELGLGWAAGELWPEN